jgi:hypothetical protein
MIAKKEVAMSAKFNIGKASGTDSFKSNPLPKKSGGDSNSLLNLIIKASIDAVIKILKINL